MSTVNGGLDGLMGGIHHGKVPAGEKPEHEKGDEIAASWTKDGFETGAVHDYGR